MKLVITGDLDELANVMGKLREMNVEHYDEEVQTGEEDIVNALRCRLMALRANLAAELKDYPGTYTLNRAEMSDIMDFLDTFLV